ncbi:MAG: transcriptional repressor LexA [Nitrospiraceae bacterium]|nr:transcriptional repressor LexA [Nitrospiraceae bacterium]
MRERTEITARQQAVYDFIREATSANGMPPTMREIGERFGIASTNGVERHLQALERRGLITRSRGRSRGIAISGAAGKRQVAAVPLLGRVAAGVPVDSPENREGDVAVDRALFALRADHRVFCLAVRGESMIDAHILDGDTVLVREQPAARNGDIVVALVEGEATVKRFFHEGETVRLQPENSSMRPLLYRADEVRIVGKVVGVMRKV